MEKFILGKSLMNVNIVVSVLVSRAVLGGTKTSTVEKCRINVTVTKVRLDVFIVGLREEVVI